MTVFYSIAALLTLLVLAWMVRPLLRPAPQAGVSSVRLNTDIYRDQLQTLERDLARSAISPVDYEATRDELQLRLLDDTDESVPAPQARRTTFWTARRTAVALALLFPLGAGGLYWWLGTPQAIDPVSAQKAEQDKISEMVDRLAARLKANPDNPKGWAMLARSYKVMGRLQEAEDAYAKAGKLIETDPDLLADYADLMAARAGGNLAGQPLVLVNKALALNPLHPMSLMLAGTAAYRDGNFAAAISYWENLLSVLEPGSPDAQQVETDIAEARAKAGMPPSAKATSSPSATEAGADASKLPAVDPAAAGAMTPERINQMVERLATRLKTNPDDLAGWARLARAYKVQGRLAEAEQAYGKAGKLVDSDPDLLAQYADLLAMRANNHLEGRPLVLVNKALALNPKHPMALMLAGSAAFQRADYAQAVAHWETVLTVLEPGSPDAAQVRAEIADARAKALAR
jgi:cytochrome c-type biogenesis protein CcmH